MCIIPPPQSHQASHEYLRERAFPDLAAAARKIEAQAAEIQKLNEALAKQKQKVYQGQSNYARLWERSNAALKLLRGEVAHMATEPTAEAELEAALKQHAAANDARHDRALIERQAEAVRQLTGERDYYWGLLADLGHPLGRDDVSARQADEVVVMAGSPPREVQRLPVVKRSVERQPDAEPRPMIMTFEDGDVWPPIKASKEGPNA